MFLLNNYGNDTIDPYPLFPGEAKKILIVKQEIFEKLWKRYKTFRDGQKGQPEKRSPLIEALNKPFSSERLPAVHREHFLPYEPSNAIAVNECDYRRWCRVNEWFAEFGPDTEKNERTILIQ